MTARQLQRTRYAERRAGKKN